MGSLSRIIQEGRTCIRTVLIKEAKGSLTPDEEEPRDHRGKRSDDAQSRGPRLATRSWSE